MRGAQVPPGDDAHRRIHAKAARRAVGIAELGRCQRRCILLGIAEVEDRDAAARLQAPARAAVPPAALPMTTPGASRP